ncbi:hypothetical protein [Nesterenkonia ebinurensis]|nr:hypothetical protein [Nesterenkonia ebinurensis]
MTITIRTGGEGIPDNDLENYREGVEAATGLDDVRVVQDDAEPDQLDN